MTLWILLLAVLGIVPGVQPARVYATAPNATAQQTVRVGVYNFQPMIFSENGQAKGFFIDMLQDVAQREGWTLAFVPGSWDECLERLKKGEIDLLPCIADTPEREKTLRFTQEFLFLDWGVIYRKNGAGIRTIFDLEGKTITALRGSVYTERLTSQLDQFGIKAYIVTKHEYAEVLASVARGEATAGICTNILGSILDLELPVERTDIVFAPIKLRTAARIGGRENLLPILDRHLAELKAQPGSLYYQLRDKWLGLAGGTKTPRWLPWALGLALGGLALLSAFAIFLRILVQRRTRELAESEQRFRAMVDDQTELVCRFTGEGVFQFVNQAFCDFFGKTAAELVGTVWAPVVFEEDLAAVRAQMALISPDNPLVFIENRNTNARGEVRWMQFANRGFFDEHGTLQYVQSVGRDITDRKLAEKALRASEERFRAVVEGTPSFITQVDGCGRFTYVNPTVRRVLGMVPEDCVGRLAFEIVHPDDREATRAAFQGWLAQKLTHTTFENRLISSSGEARHFSWSIRLHYDDAGNATVIDSIARDVTEQKRVEDALRASEERYTTALAAVNDGLWDWHVLSGDAYFSPLYYGVLGYEDREFVANYANWRLLVHPEDLERVERDLGTAIESGKGFNIDLRMRTKDGGWKWVCTRGKAIEHDTQGRVLRMVGTLSDVTHRKGLEASLRESELHFRTLANLGQALIWTSTPDKLCNYFNQPWLDFTGRSLEQELGNGWAEGVHPDDLQRCVDIYVAAFDKRERFSMEYRLRHHSGEYRWIVDQGSPRYDSQGEFLGYIGHCLDITERMRAQDKLRESEDRFRMLFENAPLPYQSLDEKGFFLDVNKRWLETLGYEKADVLGKWFGDFLGAGFKEHFDRNFPMFKQCCMIDGVEFDMVRKDGLIIRVSFNGRVQLGSDGEFLRTHCIFTDITERKQAEEALKRSEYEFRMLAEAMPQIVWVCSPDGKNIYFNQNWVDYTGMTLEESYGDGWSKPFHPDDQQLAWEKWRGAVEFSAEYNLECRLRRADGVYTWWLIRGVPVRDESGAVVKWFGTCTDIEEMKQTEAALLAAKDAAEAANRAKSEFLANMSHELRTPMNGVLGMLQLLMLEELKPTQKSYANNAFEAANRLLSLLNDILDFSRIEAGILAFRSDPYNPGDILSATRGVFEHICVRKGLTLDIHPDPGLPAVLTGDEARIRQIVFNLVGNAVKFTPQGSIRIDAWHRAGQGVAPARLYIAVSDNGVGIPEAKLGSIFDRFSQADASYTRHYEGAGLGLAIVRRIVGALGGSLCIETEQGSGTAVVLVLPAPEDTTVRPEKPVPRPTESQPSVRLRILLAEDELIGQLGAKIMLERMGHSVLAVNDGKAAVEAALAGDFDCVLMDIQMPEMDGLEATRILRNTVLPGKSRVPIIAMTAYALSGDREKFMAAGMDEYIAKPFHPEDLSALLQAVARKRRQAFMH